MSKRKAREDDNPNSNTHRPVLYYPDDGVRPTQCIMPESPVPSPRVSPVRNSTSKDSRKQTDNIGLPAEDIPTPRTRLNTSLFTRAPIYHTAPARLPTRATTLSSDNADSGKDEPEYVVDSSDDDVPVRFRVPRRKTRKTGLRLLGVPGTATKPAPTSPFRARLVPARPALLPTSQSVGLVFPEPVRSQTPPKSPRSLNPFTDNSPVPGEEVIVVSSTDSDSRPRSPSGSPSLGEDCLPAQPRRDPSSARVTPTRSRSPTCSSRSSDVVILSSSPSARNQVDGRDLDDVEEALTLAGRLPRNSSSSTSRPARRSKPRRIESSSDQDEAPHKPLVDYSSGSGSDPSQRTGPVFKERGPRSIAAEPAHYVASGSDHSSQASPPPWPSARPLFRPSTTTVSSLTPIPSLGSVPTSRASSHSSFQPDQAPLSPMFPPSTKPTQSRVNRRLRMECILLPRASRAMRDAMARFDRVHAQDRASDVHATPRNRGKGKSLATISTPARFEVEIPAPSRSRKGKAVARGENHEREQVSSLGEGQLFLVRDDTDDDYHATENGDGETRRSSSDAVATPELLSPRKRDRKSKRNVKYVVIDPRLASPSAYESLPPEIEDSPNKCCHCCRSRGAGIKLKMRCSNIVTKRRRGRIVEPHECGTLWCQRCIAKHDILFNPLQTDFTCPLCTDSCDCDCCRRDRGQDPLGKGAFKVVKRKPGRRPFGAIARLAMGERDTPHIDALPPPDSDAPPPPPLPLPPPPREPTPVPPPVPPKEGSSAPVASTSRVPARRPTTWHGPRTPPPLRRHRASGAQVLATEDHIFVPRRPREEPHIDPDELAALIRRNLGVPDEDGEQSNGEDVEWPSWIVKYSEIEARARERDDYWIAADASCLGADSVGFHAGLEVDSDEPGKSEEDAGCVSPLPASVRASVEVESVHDGGLGAEAQEGSQPDQGKSTDLAREVKALSEAILSLGEGNPSALSDTVLEELDAGIEDACRYFCGPDVGPVRQPVPELNLEIDILNLIGTDGASCDDEQPQTQEADLGQLHPEGTFDNVPGISMAALDDLESHSSVPDIPLYDAATDCSDQAHILSAPRAEDVQPQPVDQSYGELSHMLESASQLLLTLQSLPASQSDADTNIDAPTLLFDSPEPEPEPEPVPELVVATDPESTKSTILETPSPQLGTCSGPEPAGIHNLFEDSSSALGASAQQATCDTSGRSNNDKSTARTITFVLPHQEDQEKMREALQARFEAHATAFVERVESKRTAANAREGKILRSKRRYDK